MSGTDRLTGSGAAPALARCRTSPDREAPQPAGRHYDRSPMKPPSARARLPARGTNRRQQGPPPLGREWPQARRGKPGRRARQCVPPAHAPSAARTASTAAAGARPSALLRTTHGRRLVERPPTPRAFPGDERSARGRYGTREGCEPHPDAAAPRERGAMGGARRERAATQGKPQPVIPARKRG